MKEMLHPSTAEQYLSAQLEKTKTALTLRNIAIAGLILLAADLLSTFIMQAFSNAEIASENAYLGMVQGFLDYALYFYVTAYVLYLVAKVLGGRGKFKEQIYLQSVVAMAIALIQGTLVILSSFYIPEDLTLLALLSLPLLFSGLYSIYMDYKIVKVAHQHNKTRAALSIVGFWIVMVAVIFILYGALLMFTGQA